MPQRIYNSFYPWIKQDNYLTWSGSFIDAKNMDWLKEWIWITLWPKVNKAFKSNAEIFWISSEQVSDVNLNRSLAGWLNWELYKLNSSDNTPVYTITWKNIVSITTFLSDYIIFTKNLTTLSIDIYKISKSDVENNIYTSLSAPLITWALVHYWIPPLLSVWSDLFIWWNREIKKFNWTVIVDTYTFPDDYVVWLTLQGSTVWVYTRSWNSYNWDGWSAIDSARGYVGARTSKVVSLSWLDYQTTEDWQLRKWLYNQFIRIFKPNNSFRLENNTQIQKKLDFSIDQPSNLQNRVSINALDDLYFYTSDSNKWIYKYWNIISWTSQWLHKIVNKNHEWNDIDYIYDMFFYEVADRKIYFSYKAWTTYWVDYIDLDDLETSNTGYLVSEVFTGGTEFLKKLNVVRLSVSNTDANNTVTLSYRVNNWDWIEIRTINSTTEDIYYRENISVDANWFPFQQFVDIQFKLEFNWQWTNKPPTLNEMMIDYTIIEA